MKSKPRTLTKDRILKAAQEIGFNVNVLPYKTLKRAMQIELEHGLVDPRTNVTNNDLVATLKIVAAHLREGLEYYDLLIDLEKTLENNRRKRNLQIFYRQIS